MTSRAEVSPDTIPVELTADGVEVEYLDGRRVFYRGVPTTVAESVTTAPGKDVHVLVTDESESQGVLVYVNDRNTEAEILEGTGVGRVMLDQGEETTVFPAVAVRSTGMRIEVETDPTAIDGRVFVFEEDEMGERSFELVPPADAQSTDSEEQTDREPSDGGPIDGAANETELGDGEDGDRGFDGES